MCGLKEKSSENAFFYFSFTFLLLHNSNPIRETYINWMKTADKWKFIICIFWIRPEDNSQQLTCFFLYEKMSQALDQRWSNVMGTFFGCYLSFANKTGKNHVFNIGINGVNVWLCNVYCTHDRDNTHNQPTDDFEVNKKCQ